MYASRCSCVPVNSRQRKSKLSYLFPKWILIFKTLVWEQDISLTGVFCVKWSLLTAVQKFFEVVLMLKLKRDLIIWGSRKKKSQLLESMFYLTANRILMFGSSPGKQWRCFLFFLARIWLCRWVKEDCE